jgi:KipI family sensor histidine kinase inhibitor
MNTGPWPAYRPVGDAALLVEFGEAIDPAINQQAVAFAQRLEQTRRPGIADVVPTYRSVLVHYDPLALSYDAVMAWAQNQATTTGAQPAARGRYFEIPTLYGGEFGPDLDFVARTHSLSPEEVILRHSSVDYTVYMMGFMPGFPYLGGLPPELETPRLESPRTRVRAGSVGLAGKQTGIYPLDSPGGWRIIGHTSLTLFDPTLDPPALLAPGDRVRFVPVSSQRGPGGA